MFKGYFRFGDTEVINAARLVKYAAEGAAPADLTVDPHVGDYSDLAAALGEAAYRTPLLDAPPWYDATNPDSALFAGLLPLEVTGLTGSTRTRGVSEGLTAGGRPGSGRSASRTIGVTALAIAAGDGALDAGLAWLEGALHPPCDDGDDCGGAPLNLFSAAPVYCDLTPNLDVDPVDTPLFGGDPLVVDGPTLTYQELAGDLLTPVCGEVTVTAVVQVSVAGDRWAVLDLVDSTGTVYASSGPVLITVPDGGGGWEQVEVSATVDPSPGFPADWQPILSWHGTGDEDPGSITLHTLTLTSHPLLTIEECLSDLRRSFRNVVTSTGPTVTDELLLEDGTPYAAVVEWVWVATDPYPYGETTDLIRGMTVGREGLSAYAASTVHKNLAQPYPTIGITAGKMTLDGVYIPAGATVVIKNQDDPEDNGLYDWSGDFGTLTRSPLMDTWAEVVGAKFLIQNGNTQAGDVWATDVAGGGTIGVTAMPWVLSVGGGGGGYDDSIAYQADGLQVSLNADVTGAATACPVPSPVLILCGDDPTLPAIVAPPAPPVLADPGMPSVTTYVRREVQVPPEQSPQPAGALSFTICNLDDVAYRGIRVRIWADDDPDFGVTDECAWETEFYVTHIAAEQTVTINGPDRAVTTTCLSGIDADHERNMRGPYGTAFEFPLLRCGSRYHIAVDVPYVAGGGGVVVDLSVTRRGA